MLSCSICKLMKEKDAFHKTHHSSRGYSYYCKTCAKEKSNRYYNKNKQAWQQNFSKKYSGPDGRLKYLLKRSRERAKLDGIEHSITLDDLVLPPVCPYLGTSFTLEWGKGQLRTNASIDRIDPSRGYVPGNVQIVSRLANTMKNDATQAELVTFATNVLKLAGIG